MKKPFVILILLNFLLSQFFVLPVLAEFNPNFILSDAELTDYNSLNMAQIQDFLAGKKSYLATYVDPAIRITAAQAIYDSAYLHRVNPKYILVLLQKEQSLIEDGTPTDDQLNWATGYGICDDCSKSDPAVQKYKGFTNQADWGAGGTRFYFDNPDKFKYQVGSTYTIDNTQVKISNDATRALYIYTPHLHGNEMLYNIWQKWFATTYLDGSLLQSAEDGGIWLIRDNERHPFLSKSAFLSRYPDFDKVISINPADLNKFPLGAAIEYANYSLLQIPSGGIYLLDDDTLRPITSKETFRLLGFNPEEVIPVKTDDIFYYKIGEPLTEKSLYPTGALLQDKKTGGVYFVQNGVKSPIIDRSLIKLYYGKKKITALAPKELEKFATGAPLKLRDGELATTATDKAVYVITAGEKRAFATAKAFEALGYSWDNVVTVPDKILALHPTGALIQ